MASVPRGWPKSSCGSSVGGGCEGFLRSGIASARKIRRILSHWTSRRKAGVPAIPCAKLAYCFLRISQGGLPQLPSSAVPPWRVTAWERRHQRRPPISISYSSNFARIDAKLSCIFTSKPSSFVMTCMARLSAIISADTERMPSSRATRITRLSNSAPSPRF